MDRIRLGTEDGTKENVERIAGLFPGVVTEVEGADGNLEHVVDFDALGDLLGDVAEGQRERYQFTWPGKATAKAEARKPVRKTMRPEKGKSVDWDTTRNLYIEGDNLDALKLLKETYAGQVKLIYIDPPYNTGHDFVYDDDYRQTHEEYDAESGDFDEDGGRLVANPDSNGRFHSDWCSMIYPRLVLARDLLSADGAIFISIDDNEYQNLRKIGDEVFGAVNFVNTIIWEKRYSPQNAVQWFSENHDFICVYAKDKNAWRPNLLPRSDEMNARYTNRDNDPRGPWKAVDSTAQGGHGTKAQFYQLTTPGGRVVSPPDGRCWLYTEPVMKQMIADNRIWFGEDGNNIPAIKRFLSEVKQGAACQTIWKYEEVGHSQEGKKELKALFPERLPFDTPKPVRLIERILTIGSDLNSLVLDFFSGSATTAEAVMRKNADDGGTRRFVLVQLPEEVSGDWDNLCNVGEERIRRAGKKIAAEVEEANRQLKLGEEPKPVPDIGFRVLRIDSSNMKDTYRTPDETDQMDLLSLADNVKLDRTPEDLLFEVLPKCRIPYSARIEKRELGGRECFLVDGNRLVACFDTEVGTETIEEMAKLEPDYVVMRDASMRDDATQANFEELFKTYSPDTVRRVI